MPRVVVVTGCTSGIGRAIWRRLAGDGYNLVGVGRNPDRAGAARDEARAFGVLADVLSGDVADRETLENAAGRATQLGILTGWVNNAAEQLRGNLHEPMPADVDRVIRVNLLGYFWGASAAIRRFIDQGTPGSIVNISSIHARVSFPGWAAYAMSKGGISALTRSIAVEYGNLGVRANAIEPGAIWTEATQRYLASLPARQQASARRGMERLQPLGRLGQADEIAAVVAFLLSGEASFMTGACIPVDGGATSWCSPTVTTPERRRRSPEI